MPLALRLLFPARLQASLLGWIPSYLIPVNNIYIYIYIYIFQAATALPVAAAD
jgi:hypothetical protein